MLTQILGLEKNDPKVIGPLFAYLFGRINKAQYKEAIGDKAKAKEIWLKASTSGYILKNC